MRAELLQSPLRVEAEIFHRRMNAGRNGALYISTRDAAGALVDAIVKLPALAEGGASLHPVPSLLEWLGCALARELGVRTPAPLEVGFGCCRNLASPRRSTLDHAWKNAKWHVAVPLSFDLADPRRILHKATDWTGRVAVTQPRDNATALYLLVGLPSPDSDPEVRKAGADAVEMLRDTVQGQAVVVLEDEGGAVLEGIARVLREHGEGEGARVVAPQPPVDRLSRRPPARRLRRKRRGLPEQTECP